MSKWQPMETAPKHGGPILAFGFAVPEMTRTGSAMMWDDSKERVPYVMVIHWLECWYDKEVDIGNGTYRKEKTLGYAYWAPEPRQFRPTHWMPLPEFPE